MSTFKKTKVVMLPTNEKANPVGSIIEIIKPRNDERVGLAINHNYLNTTSDGNYKLMNLYFLSDEEIKEGDWVCNGIDIWQVKSYYGFQPVTKKIIATTDKSLLIDYKGYEYGTGNYYEALVYLPKPSTSFIEKFVEEYNKGNQITEVMIEYELSDYDIFFDRWKLKVNPRDNTITIRKVKDSWNRDEVIELLSKHFVDAGSKIGLGQDVTKFTKKWIEENL